MGGGRGGVIAVIASMVGRVGTFGRSQARQISGLSTVEVNGKSG